MHQEHTIAPVSYRALSDDVYVHIHAHPDTHIYTHTHLCIKSTPSRLYLTELCRTMYMYISMHTQTHIYKPVHQEHAIAPMFCSFIKPSMRPCLSSEPPNKPHEYLHGNTQRSHLAGLICVSAFWHLNLGTALWVPATVIHKNLILQVYYVYLRFDIWTWEQHYEYLPR